MPALHALAPEPQFQPDNGSQEAPSTGAPRTTARAKTAADLAQLVAELGAELARYHADRRLRLDRTPVPPSTELLLVATVPPSRPARAQPLVEDLTENSTLRAATTVTVKR